MILLILCGVLFIGFLFAYVSLKKYAERVITKYRFSTYQFTDKDTVRTIVDDPQVYLSLIVPAYNEENRIVNMLKTTVAYLQERSASTQDFSWEIIVVDDGSKDATIKIVSDFIAKHDNIRLLPLVNNQGKGFAVKQGMLRARGQYMLMLDADAATKISDVEKLERDLKKIEKTHPMGGMALGSRREVAAEADRTFIRSLISSIFNFLVRYAAGIPNVKDTQCGFKLFSRKAARFLFINQHSERWCFDIDLLILGQYVKLPFVEIPVTWKEIPGSHLTIFGMMGIIRDLFLIRLNYLLGFWKVDVNSPLPA